MKADSRQQNAFLSMTWGGHPLSMAAVIATLDVMEKGNGPQALWNNANSWRGIMLMEIMQQAGDRHLYLGPLPWNRFSANSSRFNVSNEIRKLMFSRGVLIYGAHHFSLAHDMASLRRLHDAWQDVLAVLPEHLDALEHDEEQELPTGIMRR